MNTNEATITVLPDTPLEDIITQLDALGLIEQPKPVEREFRWYYNDEGYVHATCCHLHEVEMYGLVGKYIIVDESMYFDSIKYKILNDKPVMITDDNGQRKQLEKGEEGFSVVKNNAALLLEPDDTYTNTENYGYRNN